MRWWVPARRRGPVVLGLVAVLAAGVAVFGPAGHITVAGRPTPTVGPAPQDGWTQLLNQDAGLSYQIPPAGWTTAPHVGRAGTVDLTQGATTVMYTCGSPPEPYQRGVVGSGPAPRTDPATLATAIAEQAATAYYTPVGGGAPRVHADPATRVLVRASTGATVTGSEVRAIATRPAGPCVAGSGEVLVLVLALADRNAVLVVNGDLAGGPADPRPLAPGVLRTIIGTAQPING